MGGCFPCFGSSNKNSNGVKGVAKKYSLKESSAAQSHHLSRVSSGTRNCALPVLSKACISEIISLTSPRDACRSSVISWGFKSAVDSDSVWERFLPPDCQEILSESAFPGVFSSKKMLYFSLCDSPVLLQGGKLSFALDRESGKKCYTLPARELSISWGDDPRYWTWVSLPESRFSEVAQLLRVCWFKIQAKMKIEILSPNTNYAAYLIFKIKRQDHSGFESIPVKATVRILGESPDGSGEEDDAAITTVFLTLQAGTTTSVPLGEHRGRRPGTRKDGWSEIELGEFYNDGGEDGEVEIRLREVEILNWKSGLLVEGIELRPKVNA